MNSKLFFSSSFPSLLCFSLVILVLIQSSLSDDDDDREISQSCDVPFRCGNITAGYPFWGVPRPQNCGAHQELQLSCNDDDHHLPTMVINSVHYWVLDIKQEPKTLRIGRKDYENGICSPEYPNTTINFELFDYSEEYQNATFLYDCPPSPDLPVHFPCPDGNGVKYKDWSVLAGANGPGACNASVIIPFPNKLNWTAMNNPLDLGEILKEGFELVWKVGGVPCENCTKPEGSCDPNYDLACPPTLAQPDGAPRGPPATALPEETPIEPPPSKEKKGLSSAAVAGIVAGGVAGIIVLVFLFVFIRKRRKIAAQSKTRDLQNPPTTSNGTSTTTISLSQSIPSFPFSERDFERGMKSTYFGAQVFDYTELEQATDNFHPSKELGDGGFGTVYYGLLRDGRVVAVKRLFENNLKRVEQFMNEIEILTKLRHPNLVTLYGCTSRHSRELLLVYEYIPNGTVADHIHERNSNSGLLPWRVRLSIAVETADALAFLHSSDVIHRDVKTNNILLDNDFRVKVADFGLSRLFPTDVTHVSTAPQGTPGYVDPEYYQCYHLTGKSDVYSFGVVLIELISSLEAVDTNRHRHDINLANMAISKIQNNALSELVDPALGFKKDYAVRSMVTSVAELAFRCLQQDRDARPSMQEVLDVLKGIQNEQFGALKAEVVDISTDDAALLKNAPPPISPDSAGNDKWVSCSPTPNSF